MIRRPLATSAFVPLLSAALVALALLATLQYYWVGQVSAGEHERRAANLAASARRLSEDFDRELARAYLALQMDAGTLRTKEWERYARRYERWQTTAPYPGLVKAIYLAEVNQIGRVSLSRFDVAGERFEQTTWPYEMVSLRRRLERTYRLIFSQGDAARVSIPPIERVGPALLVPMARPWLLSNQQDQGFSADLLYSDVIIPGSYTRCSRCPPELFDTPLLAYTVVILDRDYLAQTFLPALSERYFPGEGGLDYNIGVLDRGDPNSLIYSSDPRLSAASFSGGDATVGLLDISYDDLNALLLASDPQPSSSPAEDPLAGRLIIGVLGRPGEGGEAEAEAGGQWQLVLKHRLGSLDAAVNGLRTRNMLMSFGTLLLLSASMVMLFLSTRRAQRLAQQQLSFATAVSHELRTPLAVICSAGENLADGLVHDPQKARQYGTVIYGEGRRLTEMVEQVLAFASVQSGQRRYELQPVEVADLLEGAIQLVQHQLHEGGYTLELAIAPDLPPLHVDATALKRSLQNLISNAMKYGGSARWIGVGATLCEREAGAELQLTVADRGPGVDAADLPHLFEPFYRGRSATLLQTHGSGLGLSLVRHTLEAHGGRVSVESRPGHGACFTLHLPLPQANIAQGTGSSSAARRMAPRVLR